MITARGIYLGYYFGMTTLLVGQMLFLIGFICPFWSVYPGYNLGLWLICSSRDCRVISTISALFEGWWSVLQCLQCMSLLCYLVGSCHSVMVIWGSPPCLLHDARHRRCLQASAALAGCSGFLGDMVFLGKIHTGDVPYSDVSWAFVANLIGCVLAVVASVTIVVSYCLENPLTGSEAQPATDEGSVTVPGDGIAAPFHIVLQEVETRSVWSHDQASTRL